MPLSTYAELQSAVADWLDRDDLTGRVPDFISLAEAAIAAKLGVRTAEADIVLAGPAGARTVALPGGYRDAKALWITGEGLREELRMIPADLMVVSEIAGDPGAWCVDGANIAFDRPLRQARTFTLRMVTTLTLSDETPTNLILANYPNLYLFGALKEAGPFLRDNDLAAMFEAKWTEALADAKDLEGRANRRVKLCSEPGALITTNRVERTEGL